MNVVDSSAWLAYFADTPGAGFFAEPIEDIDWLLVPAICLFEVFRVVLREKGEDEALLAAAAMLQGRVIDMDAELALEAAALSLDACLPMADAIIYVATLRHGAVLWTQDSHFAGKPAVQYRQA
jgi:predicted nucleic acid-binding protein